MFESLAITAFIMGIVSAISLPLGTITARYWHPGDRTLAMLMAFGGGALLAALTIDLVGSALAEGEFYSLAIGAISGGLLFMLLNHLVNGKGGFLRKSSTTMVYLKRLRQHNLHKVFKRIGRIGFFQDLSRSELQAFSEIIISHHWKKGETLYRRHDPCQALYIIEKGSVELLDPKQGMYSFAKLGKGDAFARMAFFSNMPHATIAKAASDSWIWEIPIDAFKRRMQTSPALVTAVIELIQKDELHKYLQDRHGLSSQTVSTWVNAAIHSLKERGWFDPAIRIDHKEEAFQTAIRSARRGTLFSELSPEDIEMISEKIIYKSHFPGETFFHQQEKSERLYLIEHGEVVLLDPKNASEPSETLRAGDMFGMCSFFTGAVHSKSALATSECGVWILLKRDFELLIQDLPKLQEALHKNIKKQSTSDYLKLRHQMNEKSYNRWVKKSLKRMNAGGLIPTVNVMPGFESHSGAPLAIWLGIMLDGIPESLVIGASLVHSQLSMSLIAGLFLSNYPEALSSSVGMQQQGVRFPRILFMWTSITIMTGIGAALGNLLFVGMPAFAFAFIEGIAAGAMLVMIAETMLPEAYFKGGGGIGMATLLGFLLAIFFKTIE